MDRKPSGVAENWPYALEAMAGRPPSTEAPLFGQRLAALRKDRGMTQPQLAEVIGVSVQMIEYYERRARNPSVDTIERVAAALGVEPAYFLTGKEHKRKKPGPPSALEKRIERLRRLPKKEQEVVLKMLDGLLSAAR